MPWKNTPNAYLTSLILDSRTTCQLTLTKEHSVLASIKSGSQQLMEELTSQLKFQNVTRNILAGPARLLCSLLTRKTRCSSTSHFLETSMQLFRIPAIKLSA